MGVRVGLISEHGEREKTVHAWIFEANMEGLWMKENNSNLSPMASYLDITSLSILQRMLTRVRCGK